MIKYLKHVIFVLVISITVAETQAGQATLQWDANAPEDNVIGYNVYEYQAVNCSYTNRVKTGTTADTHANVNFGFLEMGINYYHVTAFNAIGESGPSELVKLELTPISLIITGITIITTGSLEIK